MDHSACIVNRVRVFLFALLQLVALGAFGQNTFMTFNIRYDNPSDGKNSWPQRQAEVVSLIDQLQPDFLGIQEGLKHQVDYIQAMLPEYAFIGVGRDDGATQGEYAAIFYQPKKAELLWEETFWLSETPKEVSKGWDAALPRICTIGAFRLRQSNTRVYVFNTHFDHLGETARLKSAELILAKIRQLGLQDSALVLMGDFNAEPTSDAIAALSAYFSKKEEQPVEPNEGFVGTFNGFDATQLPSKRIDYIFVQGLNIVRYEHITTRRANGLWISDHLPVFCEVVGF